MVEKSSLPIVGPADRFGELKQRNQVEKGIRMRLQTEEALKAIKFFASSSTFEQKLADFAHLGQQLANSPAFVESLTDIELPKLPTFATD